VVTAGKVKVTGNKTLQKVYYRHSGYPGGLKETPLERMMEKHPERVIQAAVKGMLPHNRLGRRLLRHLKVYGGAQHPHEAQVNAGVRRKKAKAAPAAQDVAAAPEPEEAEIEAPAEDTELEAPAEEAGVTEAAAPAVEEPGEEEQE
jgi:hypothetical protein